MRIWDGRTGSLRFTLKARREADTSVRRLRFADRAAKLEVEYGEERQRFVPGAKVATVISSTG